MIKRFNAVFSKIARSILINLGLMAVSLPLFAASLVVTLSLAFWLYNLAYQGDIGHVSRRVLLVFSLPGCLGTLVLNGLVIYRLNRYLEERFKEK